MPEYVRADFLETKDGRRPFTITTAYQLRMDRPLPWLQRICCRILDKLRAHYTSEYRWLERIHIDYPTVIEAIHQQYVHLRERFNLDGKTLLVGAEDFEKIMHAPEIREYFQFHIPPKHVGHDCILGLTVQVIPWMRGMIVMP